jgi:NADH-quinone oxidoreductase subunit M
MIWGLVFGPLIAGVWLYMFPRRLETQAKWVGIVVAFANIPYAVRLVDSPDESLPWLRRPFEANFHIGLGHGLAFWLVLLAALSTGFALLSTRVPRQRDFTAQMLLLLAALTGVFVARDLLLFALFFDVMLLPVFIILVAWGPRTGTAWRYLLYNAAGGLGLLLATAVFGMVNHTTDVIGKAVAGGVTEIQNLGPLGHACAPWIFAGFVLAFAIKTPLWPMHTWMPDTYADLPVPAAAVVSAVQSKAGLYGLIVIGMALFPTFMHQAASLMVVLGVISLLYGALIAFTQDDVKRIVAYSSLSHLGLIVLAIFSFNAIALAGAAVYIIAHGLFSAALFLVLGSVERREETRSLVRLGGLGVRNPRLAGAFIIAALAALGLPGLCGFAGELLILTGLYKAGFVWAAALALIAIVLSAGYMLRLFQGVMHGPGVQDAPARPDLTFGEGLALAPLVLAIVLLGVDAGPLARVEPQLVREVALDSACLPPNVSAQDAQVRLTAAAGLTQAETADILISCYAFTSMGRIMDFNAMRAEYLRGKPFLTTEKEQSQ